MRWILLMPLLAAPLPGCRLAPMSAFEACERLLDACVAECQEDHGVEKSGSAPECYKTCGGAYAACRVGME